MIEATLKRLEESRSDAPPELFVEGVVRKESGGFVVSLVLRDPSGRGLGEREVRVERQSCQDVEGTAALVLALMIAVARPNLVAPPETQGDAAATPSTIAPEAPSPEAPSPAPLRTPPGRPPAKAAVVHAPVASSPAELPLRVLLGASGSASVGVLPGAGLGVGVRAMVAPWSAVLIGVEASLDRGATVPSHSGEVGFAMLAAAARVGLSALQTTQLELIPTASLRGGIIRTSPQNLRNVASDERTVALAGVGVLARAKLGHGLFAEALPEVAAVFFRRQFQVRSDGALDDVHRVGPVETRISVGLGYEFR